MVEVEVLLRAQAYDIPSCAEDWEEDEAQGEDLLSDEEGDKEPEDNLDYKVRIVCALSLLERVLQPSAICKLIIVHLRELSLGRRVAWYFDLMASRTGG